MSVKIWTQILTGSAAAGALAFGLALSASAQPMGYDSGNYQKSTGDFPPYASDDTGNYQKATGDMPYAASDYSADTSATVGGLTVYGTRRVERGANGAPIEPVTASRVVPYGDLDLSTGWGVHELHSRVERAAADACDELDNTPGLIPMDSDADCQNDAVHRAMDQAPISYPGY